MPSIGLDKAYNHIEGGCLTRSIGTQKAYNLSLFDFQGDTFDHFTSFVFFYYIFSS